MTDTSAPAVPRPPTTCVAGSVLSLRPGVRVLDVGSGIGGAAFHLARTYGAKVTGIDLAEEMVAIALERASRSGMTESVTFLLGDVLETSFAEPFDIVWSRDAFMHIPDKPRLFSRLHQLLADRRPAGDHRLRSRQEPGLAGVRALHRDDRLPRGRADTSTAGCSRPPDFGMSSSTTRRRGSSRFSRARPTGWSTNRGEFLASFSEADLNYLVDRWAMKVRFCRGGDMKWGNLPWRPDGLMPCTGLSGL